MYFSRFGTFVADAVAILTGLLIAAPFFLVVAAPFVCSF